MFRVISILLLVACSIAAYVGYSTHLLPAWFEDASSKKKQLSEAIKPESMTHFLGDKVADIGNGELVLTEVEFNALFLASLELDENGQKLLSVSDGVNAIMHDDYIELGAIINLDKVEKMDVKARQAVEKVNRIFPFLDGSRVAVTVFGNPVVREGEVGIKDDFHIKVGAIPVSNDSLRQLGANVEMANTLSLQLKHLTVNAIGLKKGEIILQVLPMLVNSGQ